MTDKSPSKAGEDESLVTIFTGQNAPWYVQWVMWRLISCCVCSFLLILISGLVLGVDGEWWQKRGLIRRDGWILDEFGGIRVSWIATVGGLIGMLLPNKRLPEWSKRLSLTGLTGGPVGLLGLFLLDAVLAARAVERAYAPFPNLELGYWLNRPHPDSKLYPSIFREWSLWAMLLGSVCGLISGCGWITSGRNRKILFVIAATIFVVGLVVAWWLAEPRFDYYVEWIQKQIRERIGTVDVD